MRFDPSSHFLLASLIRTVLIFPILVFTPKSDAFYMLRERLKRQEVYRPPELNYNMLQPSGVNPSFSPGGASQNSPQWPFAHTFSNGLDVVPKPIVSLGGHLDIRDVKKLGSVWDMKGNLTGGSNHAWYNYGHLIQPVNRYNMSPSTFSSWTNSQQFRDARANSSAVPVAQLPGGWSPVECKPPLCNPFVHTVAAGVDVMPASGGFVQGGLDFPVTTLPNGSAVRFPLNGNLFAGRQPINVQYGQHINPVNPFLGYEMRQNKMPLGNADGGVGGLQGQSQNGALGQLTPDGQADEPVARQLELPPGYN